MSGSLNDRALGIDFLTVGLSQDENGVWLTESRVPVSYPVHGNAACRELEERSFWFRHRNSCIVSVVKRSLPHGVFLDIGGGNGYVAKGLVEAGVNCVLVEPGIDGALAARERGIEHVICARLEDLLVSSGTVAAVGMFDVLEHIKDEAPTLGRVHGLLKPGGSLFLTVPSYQWLHSVDDVLAGHYRRYTISGLSKTLAVAGFRLQYASYMFAPLPPLVFLLRTVPSRLGLRSGEDPTRESAEHTPRGLAGSLMDRLLLLEARRIGEGRTLPFGGSCIVVAVKD